MAVTAAPQVLASSTWPEVVSTGVVAVPLGACEQHGPHLPLGTDTCIAAALAGRLAGRRPGITCAPALPYGASGEHARFAGTLSLGTEALRHLLVELVRSADAFSGVVLVSAHGGNSEAVRRATAELRAEGRRVLAWAPSSIVASRAAGRPADAHAGWTETSVMLALAPGEVRLPAAVAGARAPLAALLEPLRRSGVAAVSPNGVLGDPAGASAALGWRVLEAWTDELVDAVDAWAAPDRDRP